MGAGHALSTHCAGYPDNKVYGANMGPTWGQQDPGGPHVGPMNLAFWVNIHCIGLNSCRNVTFIMNIIQD